MTVTAIGRTDSGKALTHSSGHFAPRVYNQSASDIVSGFYNQTAAAGARVFISYKPIEPSAGALHKAILEEDPSDPSFDLPEGHPFTVQAAASLGLALGRRRSDLAISEIDLGSDL